MANVITQFLVGLGISYDGKGAEQAEKDIDNLGKSAEQAGSQMDDVGKSLDKGVKTGVENSKSRIMSLVTTFKAAGLAMSGVAAGVGAAWAFESKKAQQAYDLNNQLVTSQFGPTEVYGLGALAEQRGGDRQATTNSLLNIERGINRIQTGDVGMIQQLAVAGIRVDNPTGRTREDIYSDIAGQFQRLDMTRQSNVADILGLDPATVRVWQEFGATTLEVSKARAAEMGYTEQHNAALNAINQTMIDTQQKFESLGNTIADMLVPDITSLSNTISGVVGRLDNWLKTSSFGKDVSEHGIYKAYENAMQSIPWIKKMDDWINNLGTNANDSIIDNKSSTVETPAWGGTPFWAKRENWVNDSDNRTVDDGTLSALRRNNSLYNPATNDHIVNNTTNTEQLPLWAWQPQRENSSPVNDGSYGAEVSPVTDNYAQQSRQMSRIMESINRPIQLNGNFTTQGDVILDGNAIGRYTVNHLETQVYPQAIDQTRQRSY
ncbi:hypothetical protein LGFCKLCI_00033 [Klebsiella phage vB_KpnM_SCNJ1-Y]|nr:hypothetical protein LGFCKLCI_00033 [Klebsiella phage vB_KpnM_SCNJ1-Y]